jgi:hypothetical protein
VQPKKHSVQQLEQEMDLINNHSPVGEEEWHENMLLNDGNNNSEVAENREMLGKAGENDTNEGNEKPNYPWYYISQFRMRRNWKKDDANQLPVGMIGILKAKNLMEKATHPEVIQLRYDPEAKIKPIRS